MKNSNEVLTVVDGQGALPLCQPVEQREDPPIEVIASYPSRTDSIKSAIHWSNVIGVGRSLTEGEVADALGINKGQWSRIMSGTAHFPTEGVHTFNKIVGNTILTRYDAYIEGYELRPLKSKLEKQLEDERTENAELQAKLEHFQEFMNMGKG
ncbi:MAG: hypothetical protein DIZ77_06395 [endosymbiont of Seepiophila jonesi]|uniref:Uncharacterized protein n=1 Tax=endosymbiont of Lamellibrachia luymesi TaxID=2200907 RepID=A0A370E122_9GAMM|nr:MAG: hypothetical protein DIZ79_04950 [endosymbiont of Lamellibrachia luymesi]RDH93173.1 MAG: hypothetical protein DIZ77_06395 [endosymbiont of Seepiophila jonesi]